MSPVGRLTLACDSDNLIGLWIEGQKHYGESLSEEVEETEDSPLLRDAKGWLDRYFEGKRPSPSELPLAPEGTEFRKEVWKIIREIPYGELITYCDISNKIEAQRGKRMCGQAVGRGVSFNPIAIIIPCHRVVGINRKLTGYTAGLGTKIQLLEHEGIDTSRLRMPREKRKRNSKIAARGEAAVAQEQDETDQEYAMQSDDLIIVSGSEPL
jgi:methylated-DNA-[protein]-cysteine S-methyltransferase